MHICLLTNNTRMDNGWGRSSRELIEALRRTHVEVTPIVEEGGGLAGEKILLARAQANPFFVFLNAVRLIWALGEYDIIHAFDGYPYSIMGALANIFLRKKFVITLHGTYALDPFYGGPLPRLYRWALRQADRVIAVSRFTLQAVSEHCRLLRSVVIGNGTASFWLDTPRTNTVLKIPKPYVVSVGMIKPQKGFGVSLRAFAAAKKKYPHLSYALVGNQRGRHFAEIKKLVADLGIEHAVYFFEHISDDELLSLYDHTEFFLLTPVRMGQYIEGFGLVYREAGARGLAVIGSKDCGAEDAVEDGITGILCPQSDDAAVAAAMEKLLGDAALRKCMGEAGKKLANAWTWDRVAEEYHRAYAEILKDKQKSYFSQNLSIF